MINKLMNGQVSKTILLFETSHCVIVVRRQHLVSSGKGARSKTQSINFLNFEWCNPMLHNWGPWNFLKLRCRPIKTTTNTRVHRGLCLSLSFCVVQSVNPSIGTFVCLSVCLSVYLAVDPSLPFYCIFWDWKHCNWYR